MSARRNASIADIQSILSSRQPTEHCRLPAAYCILRTADLLLTSSLHEHIRPGFEACEKRLSRLLDAIFGDHAIDGDVHAFARVVGLLDGAGRLAVISHYYWLVWRRDDIINFWAAHANTAIGLGAIQ